jgi:8-oxo-dGTP diphosphatase
VGTRLRYTEAMSDAKLDLLTVPSPFYRVTAKAIILDDHARLLVVKNHNGNWELPGGGWEHDESFEDALIREIQEELGVAADTIGDIYFTYRGINVRRGFMTLRLAAPATLHSYDFKLGDDILAAEFITREQFKQIDLQSNEGAVSEHADMIWQQK